jgi:molybdopterin molybdotransferase
MMSLEQALQSVKAKLGAGRPALVGESLPLLDVRGRVLARDVNADRDYPPFDRSTRDGYAVRSADLNALPVTLNCIGEARAGRPYAGTVENQPRACVEIMTGAPVPAGTDAVVMLEHVRAAGRSIEMLRPVGPYENVVRQGSEAPAGSVVLPRGRRLQAGDMGLLASLGLTSVEVFRRPTVSILPTGDEIVPVDRSPQWFQIRNSNAITLAAAVSAAGGIPRILEIAPDDRGSLRRLVEQALESDLVILSGGVSAGKYDFVERVLAELGAEFYFQSVAIRPGKPLVFGRVRDRFFFGLPGNPVSTFVTFNVFARPALAVLEGAEFEEPIFTRARIGRSFRQNTGLTTFMPARLERRDCDPVVNLVGWQGSGDLVGLASANCFLVVHSDQTELLEGDWVDVWSVGS